MCTRPYHALFMHNMLIRPSKEELDTFGEPDIVIYNAGQAQQQGEAGPGSAAATVPAAAVPAVLCYCSERALSDPGQITSCPSYLACPIVPPMQPTCTMCVPYPAPSVHRRASVITHVPAHPAACPWLATLTPEPSQESSRPISRCLA